MALTVRQVRGRSHNEDDVTFDRFKESAVQNAIDMMDGKIEFNPDVAASNALLMDSLIRDRAEKRKSAELNLKILKS